MVAEIPTASDLPKLSAKKLRFAVARSQGATQAKAYQLAQAHEVALPTAEQQGCKWDNLPEIRAKVRELQTLADEQAVLRISERRALLADTARSVVGPASHSERVAALKLDAQLAGDLNPDGPQVNISFASALSQLKSSLSPALAVDLEAVTPPPVTLATSPATGGAPKLVAEVGAMGGHKNPESPQGLFTNPTSTPVTSAEVDLNEVLSGGVGGNLGNGISQVFTNELGEEEER